MAMADLGSIPISVEAEETGRERSYFDLAMNDGERLVLELDAASQISLRFPDQTGGLTCSFRTKAPECAVAGGVAGGLVAGALGLAVGLGILAVPWGAPLLVAGPILAALSGVGAGVTVGGLAGALLGSRVSQVEAKPRERYGRSDMLISVVPAEDAAGRARVLVVPAHADDPAPSAARLTTHH